MCLMMGRRRRASATASTAPPLTFSLTAVKASELEDGDMVASELEGDMVASELDGDMVASELEGDMVVKASELEGDS